MVETLEHLIREAVRHPKKPRAGLYKELLRSETYLLTLDAPLQTAQATRVTRPGETLPVWADKDPELGGVWVPVFPAKDAVARFVAARRLKAPRGKEFLWMGHQPGRVFPLLQGVKCFAGVRLHFDEEATLRLAWPEVRALSQGQIPSERPEIYDLPVARLVLPSGARLAFGSINAGPEAPKGRFLCLPEAGHFRPEDARRLVRLPLSSGTAWMPCRHFLQVLRYLRATGAEDGDAYIDDLLCSLIGFEMYGEAEALCGWLERQGREAYAWVALAAVYVRTGRLQDCVELCGRGARKYPAERAFALNGARALGRLGRKEEALQFLEEAARRIPGDKKILETLREFSSGGS